MDTDARRWGAVLGVATAIGLVVAACGGGGGATPTPKPTPTPAATAAPSPTRAPTAAPTPTPTPFLGAITPTPTPVGERVKTGGILRTRELRAFEPLDTYDLRGKFGILWLQNVLNNLVKQDPATPAKIVPDLAERWDVSADGRTVTFFLRKGVKWHDGKPFTAQDVLFNFTRAKNPASPLLTSNLQPMKVVDTMAAVDDLTFRVTLSRPSAFFLAGVSAPFFLIYPSHIGDVTANWKNNPVATGPFRVTDYKSELSAKLVRNEAYFLKDEEGRQLPYLDGIDFQFITDNTTALGAFRSGRLDCGCGSDFTTPQGDTIRKAAPEITVVEFSEDANHYYFNNRPPWNNLNVRKAVHLALNFKEINAVSRGGKGFYPPTFILAKELGGSWALSADEMLKYPGYRLPKDQDLAESKRLLAAAGVDPSKTKLRVQGIGFYADFTEAFATQLRAQGWDLDLVVNPSTSQRTQSLVQGDFDLAFTGGGRAIDDPADIFLEQVTSKGGSNFGKWSDPDIDRLALDQDAELDAVKRGRLIDEMQRRVLDQVIFMPAMNIVTTKVLWPWVKGFFPGRYDVSSALRLERLWLNK